MQIRWLYTAELPPLSPAGLRVITDSVTTTLRSNIIISIPRAHGQNANASRICELSDRLIRETARAPTGNFAPVVPHTVRLSLAGFSLKSAARRRECNFIVKNLISYEKKEQRELRYDEIVITARNKKMKGCILKQELRYIYIFFFF